MTTDGSASRSPEQLTLVDAPAAPKLTGRQVAVLIALENAGADGLDTDQAGAIDHELLTTRWQHSRDQRCQWCALAGKSILKALEAKGLARYRRADRRKSQDGVWLATSNAQVEVPSPRGMLPDDAPLPY